MLGIGLSLWSATAVSQWQPPALANLAIDLRAIGNRDSGSGGTDFARFHTGVYHAEQATIARQPSITNAAHGPAGKRAIHLWQAHSDHLTADAVAPLMNGTDRDFTIALYGRTLVTNNNGDTFTLSHSTGQAYIKFQLPGNTQRYRVIVQGNTGTASTLEVTAVNANTGHRSFFARRAAGQIQIWINGVQRASNTFSKGASTFDRCTIGGFRDSGGFSRPWSGQIVRHLFYPGYAMTDAERLDWENNIAANP